MGFCDLHSLSVVLGKSRFELRRGWFIYVFSVYLPLFCNNVMHWGKYLYIFFFKLKGKDFLDCLNYEVVIIRQFSGLVSYSFLSL